MSDKPIKAVIRHLTTSKFLTRYHNSLSEFVIWCYQYKANGDQSPLNSWFNHHNIPAPVPNDPDTLSKGATTLHPCRPPYHRYKCPNKTGRTHTLLHCQLFDHIWAYLKKPLGVVVPRRRCNGGNCIMSVLRNTLVATLLPKLFLQGNPTPQL